MSGRIYDLHLWVLFDAGWYLTDEAHTYIYDHLDTNNEAAVRHVLRYLCTPIYESSDEVRRAILKAGLRWYLNCADDRRLRSLFDSQTEWPVDYADEPRRTYEWLWQELIGDEPWRSADACQDELIRGNPPAGAGGLMQWSPPIDERVLLFPRKDGLPPGTDAPPVNKEPPRRY